MALRAHSDPPQDSNVIRQEERRCATRSGFAARARGLSVIYWAAMRGASKRDGGLHWHAQLVRASLKCWGGAREGVPRSTPKRRSARNSSANRKKRDHSPAKGRGPPGRASPPLQ